MQLLQKIFIGITLLGILSPTFVSADTYDQCYGDECDDIEYNYYHSLDKNKIRPSKTKSSATTTAVNTYETNASEIFNDAKNNKASDKTLNKLRDTINAAITAAKQGEEIPVSDDAETDAIIDDIDEDNDEDNDNNQDTRTDEQKAADLKEKQDAYDAAKENEQSWENRLLTAGTTAATGFGGMELAQGLAEQKADEAAAADMAAYIDTMRCTYGDGTSVHGGLTPVELPGGNNIEMMNLRAEYFALAESVKNRKESLGMAPGIESEVILDKSNMGLYDNENTGITGGTYSSLYRANLLNSESDQSQITSDKEKSDERVKYGTIAAVAGVGVGLVGNSLINGKLGELFKNDDINSQTKKLAEKEQDALDDLKKCLKSAGVKNTDDLSFERFYPSIVLVDNINCRHDLSGFKSKDASNLFADSTNEYTIYDTLVYYITKSTLQKMFGADRATRTSITNTIRESIESVKKKFQDALEQDKKAANKLGIIIGEVSDADITNGLQYLRNYKAE